MDYTGLGVRLEIIDHTLQATNRILSNLERLQSAARTTASTFDQLGNTALHMNSLMEAGFALNFAGDSIQKAGAGILGMFGKMGKAVIDTGSQFETFRKTLIAFYKDSDTVEKKLNWAIDFAAATPFDVEGTMRSLIGFKAIQIDVDKQVAGLDGVMRPFLSYIGDLAALRPDQGMSGILMALRELSGGNAVSFRRRMDIDPNRVLGRKVSTDPEQFVKDVTELSQKLAPNLMSNLEGTWAQMLMNLGDQWKKFLLKIADAGAFDSAKKTLSRLFVFLNETDEQRMKNFAKTISNIFNFLWKPIDLAVRGVIRVVEWVEKFGEKYPNLTKWITGFVAMGGAVLVGTGFLLKMTGGILLAGAAMTQLIVAIAQVRGKTAELDTAFMKIVGGTRRFLSVVAGGVLLFSLGMLAYNKNFLGFRDTVDRVVDNFVKKWKLVTGVIERNDPVEIKFLDRFEKALANVILLWGALGNLFTSDNGNEVIFSKEEHDRLQNFGLWDTVVKMVMLKDRVEDFFKGIAEGFKEIAGYGKDFVTYVLNPIVDFAYNNVPILGELFDKLLALFGIKIGETGDKDHWFNLGKGLGEVLAILVGFKVVTTILKPFQLLYGYIAGIATKMAQIIGLGKTIPPSVGGPGTGGGAGGPVIIPGQNGKPGAPGAPNNLPPRSQTHPDPYAKMNIPGWTTKFMWLSAFMNATEDQQTNYGANRTFDDKINGGLWGALDVGSWFGKPIGFNWMYNKASDYMSNPDANGAGFRGDLERNLGPARDAVYKGFTDYTKWVDELFTGKVDKPKSSSTPLPVQVNPAQWSQLVQGLLTPMTIANPYNATTGAGLMSSLSLSRRYGITQYAEGDIVDKPTPGIFGEAGEEANIPLSNNKRSRGRQLLNIAARKLGVNMGARGGSTSVDQSVTIQNLNVTIPGGSGQLGTPDSAREHAKLLMIELKKMLRNEKIRGGENVSLEDMILNM